MLYLYRSVKIESFWIRHCGSFVFHLVCTKKNGPILIPLTINNTTKIIFVTISVGCFSQAKKIISSSICLFCAIFKCVRKHAFKKFSDLCGFISFKTVVQNCRVWKVFVLHFLHVCLSSQRFSCLI